MKYEVLLKEKGVKRTKFCPSLFIIAEVREEKGEEKALEYSVIRRRKIEGKFLVPCFYFEVHEFFLILP